MRVVNTFSCFSLNHWKWEWNEVHGLVCCCCAFDLRRQNIRRGWIVVFSSSSRRWQRRATSHTKHVSLFSRLTLIQAINHGERLHRGAVCGCGKLLEVAWCRNNPPLKIHVQWKSKSSDAFIPGQCNSVSMATSPWAFRISTLHLNLVGFYLFIFLLRPLHHPSLLCYKNDCTFHKTDRYVVA